jgi:hypothetical protein
MMDSPAMAHKHIVTTAIEQIKAFLNSLGSFMADSTGKMIHIPSKLYRIPHNAIGALIGFKVGWNEWLIDWKRQGRVA